MSGKSGPPSRTGSATNSPGKRSRPVSMSISASPVRLGPPAPVKTPAVAARTNSPTAAATGLRGRTQSAAPPVAFTVSFDDNSITEHSFTSFMSPDAIKRATKTANFKEVRSLKLWQSDAKIQYMENLALLPNLQELDLSDNQIDKMRNLETSKQLKILNLASNALTTIDCIESLQRLQDLNLSDNAIERIPSTIRNLVSLQTLNLGNNKLSNMRDVALLKPLKNLTKLTLMGNPIAELDHLRLFVIFTLPTLSVLDDLPITDGDRMLANERFSQGEIEELEGKLAQANASVAQLQKDIATKEDDLKKAISREEALRKKMSDGGSKVATLESELATTNDLLSQKTSELVSLCGLLYEMKQELALLNIDKEFDAAVDPSWHLVEDTLAKAGRLTKDGLLTEVEGFDEGGDKEIELKLDSPYIGQKASTRKVRVGDEPGDEIARREPKGSDDDESGSGSDDSEESLEFDDDGDGTNSAELPSAPVVPASDQSDEFSLRKQLFGQSPGVDLNQVVESLRQTIFQQELAIRELSTNRDQLERAIADRDVALAAEQLRLASMEEGLRQRELGGTSAVESAKLAEMILQLQAAQEMIRRLEEEIARLKGAADDSIRLTQQMDQLRNQTDMEKRALSDTLASISTTLKFHSGEAEELRKTRGELELKLIAAEKESSLVKLERDDLKRRLDRAEQTSTEATEQAGKKAQELLDMTSQNFFLQEKAKSLQRQQEELERLLESLRQQLKEKDAAILEREKQILAKLRESAADHALELARTADKAVLDSAIGMLKNQISMQEEMASKRQAELEEKLKQRSEEVDQLRNQLTDATDHIRDQSKDLEAAMKDTERVDELTNELKEKDQMLGAKDAVVQEKDEAISALQTQLTAEKSIAEDLRAQLAALQERFAAEVTGEKQISDDLKSKLTELEERMRVAFEEAEASHNSAQGELAFELAKIKAELAAALERIKELEDELAQSKQSNEEASAKFTTALAEKDAALTQAKSDLESKAWELETTTKQLALKEDALKEVQAQIQTLEADLAATKAAKEEEGNKLSETLLEKAKKLAEQKALAQRLQGELDRSQEKIKEQGVDLQKALDQADELKQQIASHQDALQAAKSETSEIVKSKQSNHEELETLKQKLEKELQAANDENSKLRATISSLEDDYLAKINAVFVADEEEPEGEASAAAAVAPPRATSLDQACHSLQAKLTSLVGDINSNRDKQSKRTQELEKEIAELKERLAQLEDLKITNFFSEEGNINPKDVALAENANAPVAERTEARKRLDEALRRQMIYTQRLLASKMQALKHYWTDDAIQNSDVQNTEAWDYWGKINDGQFFYLHMQQQIAAAKVEHDQQQQILKDVKAQVAQVQQQLEDLVNSANTDAVETVVHENKADLSFLDSRPVQPSKIVIHMPQERSVEVPEPKVTAEIPSRPSTPKVEEKSKPVELAKAVESPKTERKVEVKPAIAPEPKPAVAPEPKVEPKPAAVAELAKPVEVSKPVEPVRPATPPAVKVTPIADAPKTAEPKPAGPASPPAGPSPTAAKPSNAKADRTAALIQKFAVATAQVTTALSNTSVGPKKPITAPTTAPTYHRPGLSHSSGVAKSTPTVAATPAPAVSSAPTPATPTPAPASGVDYSSGVSSAPLISTPTISTESGRRHDNQLLRTLSQSSRTSLTSPGPSSPLSQSSRTSLTSPGPASPKPDALKRLLSRTTSTKEVDPKK